jgi:hypothetical protein
LSELITDKAAKGDDADVPTSLWDRRITFIFPHAQRSLDWFRNRILFLRGRALYKEFVSYLSSTYGSSWSQQLYLGRSHRQLGASFPKKARHGGFIRSSLEPFTSLDRDASVGVDCLSQHFNSSWWQWSYGSTLFFWRWGIHSALARDGFAPFVQASLPRYTTPAKRPKRDKIPLLVPKFKLILDRGYVKQGNIQSFIDYFDVPKTDDIRLVYNGSSCGLNAALWAPNFWLPTAKTAMRALDFNFYSVDMDLGDMFLNYPLHQDVSPASILHR